MTSCLYIRSRFSFCVLGSAPGPPVCVSRPGTPAEGKRGSGLARRPRYPAEKNRRPLTRQLNQDEDPYTPQRRPRDCNGLRSELAVARSAHVTRQPAVHTQPTRAGLTQSGYARAATEAQRRRPFNAGSSRAPEKSRWNRSVPSTPSSHVRGRARERRERLHPHTTCRTSRPSPARGRGAARRASRTLLRMSRRC